MKYYKEYDVDIIDESIESLKEKGMVNDHGSIDGILLQVESIKFISEDEVM
jgi:hypothetical protein